MAQLPTPHQPPALTRPRAPRPRRRRQPYQSRGDHNPITPPTNLNSHPTNPSPQILTRLLNKHRYPHHTAENGAEAVEAYRAMHHSLRLILMGTDTPPSNHPENHSLPDGHNN